MNRLMSRAASSGSFEMLRWIKMQQHFVDRNFNDGGLLSAIRRGQFEIAKYLVGYKDRIDRWSRKYLPQCARCRDLEMLEWLHEQQLTQDTPG